MRGSVKGSASIAQHSTLIPTPELPCLREADAWGHCPNVENDLSHDQSKKGWWTCPGSPVKCRAKKQTPPLTILGVERNAVFLFGADWTAGTFNFFGSLLGRRLMFAVLFLLARCATATDPQQSRICLNSEYLEVQDSDTGATRPAFLLLEESSNVKSTPPRSSPSSISEVQLQSQLQLPG